MLTIDGSVFYINVVHNRINTAYLLLSYMCFVDENMSECAS